MTLHPLDIMKFISEMGLTRVGTDFGHGDLHRAMEMAIDTIERQGNPIDSARRIICWLSLREDILLSELNGAMEILDAKMHANAEILWDARFSEKPEIVGIVILAGAVVQDRNHQSARPGCVFPEGY